MPRNGSASDARVVDVDLYSEVAAPIADLEEDPDNIRLENHPDTVDGLSRALEHAGRYDVAPRVWETPDGKLRALAGSGRVRAAKQAQRRNGDLRQIPVVRVPAPRDRAEKVMLQFAENALRDPLGPVDFGRGLKMLHAEGLTYDAILAELKARGIVPRTRTRPWVTQMIQLTELQAGVQRLVNRGDLSIWQALQLRHLAPDEQVRTAGRIVSESLSRDGVRDLVTGSALEADMQSLRDRLAERAGEAPSAPLASRRRATRDTRHGPVTTTWTVPPITRLPAVTPSHVQALEAVGWFGEAAEHERALATEAVAGGYSATAAVALVQRAVDEAPQTPPPLRELLVMLGQLGGDIDQLRAGADTAPAEFARLRLKTVLDALG